MKILIFGDGYLGRRLSKAYGAPVTRVRLEDSVLVRLELTREKPDVVINCAGKTGRPNVDWCEDHQAETFLSNTVGPIVLAKECQALGIYLLHIGSGCIFYNRMRGIGEGDLANPLSVYSKSKYAADLALQTMPNVGIARIRMPIDVEPGPRNLITKLAGFKQVIFAENSVTIVPDLIPVLLGLCELRAQGIFHAVNPGPLSHVDILRAYRAHVDPAFDPEIISPEELKHRGLVKATRSNCRLTSENLSRLGLQMPYVMERIDDVMKEYARHAG